MDFGLDVSVFLDKESVCQSRFAQISWYSGLVNANFPLYELYSKALEDEISTR